jgi:serine/threonine protein kinase
LRHRGYRQSDPLINPRRSYGFYVSDNVSKLVGEPEDIGVPGVTGAVEIGHGGFGKVYRAYQPDLDRMVAVKVLFAPLADQNTRASFTRECRSLGRLHGNENILVAFASGESRFGFPYLIMEYLANGSLGDRLKVSGRLPWTEAVEVGVRVARALQFAHDNDVLHRDVKPDNILVADNGQPRLADFGIAGHVMGTQTQGPIPLTPSYAAPEIFSGGPATVRSDVYSLAATLFALIAGRPAFAEEDAPAIAVWARVATDPVPDLGEYGVPEALCAVIEDGMAKEALQRPASAEVFADRLESARPIAISGESTNPPRRPADKFSTRRDPPGREHRRRRLALLAAGTAVTAAVVAAFLLGGQRGGAPPPVTATSRVTPTTPGSTASTGTAPGAPTSLSVAATPTTLGGVVLGRDLLPVSDVSCHSPGFAAGSSWEIGEVRMNNVDYLSAYYCTVFSGSEGSLDFTLGKQYSTFRVTVGFADTSSTLGRTVVFSVIGDGAGYLVKPVTIQAGQIMSVAANVSNTSRLTLMIGSSSAGNVDAPTTVVWANPRVERT